MTYAEGGGSVYYQDTKESGLEITLLMMVCSRQTNSLTLSEVQNEEGVHDLDLDGDGVVGDTIESVLANDGQGKAIFKTTTGSYIVDNSTLNVGDQTNDPTILMIKQLFRRGKTTTSLHKFSSDPTGVFQFKDGSGVGVYYATTAVKQHGNGIALIQMAYLSRRIR